MNCSSCGSQLVLAEQGYKSELNSTEVHRINLWVCVNDKCQKFAGKDLKKPLVVDKRTEEIMQSTNI